MSFSQDDDDDQPPVKRFRTAQSSIEPQLVDTQNAKPSDESVDAQGLLGNRTSKVRKSTECPYLGTINRQLLDFDFEKVCSISLHKSNVYCCLVCGKYYLGRGPQSNANLHSMLHGHYVFINLETAKFYCLPENYEIIDNSLADIKYNLRPTYTKAEVSDICRSVIHAKALDGSDFIPGLIGLNDINGATDYANVIIQLICLITPVRNFFLLLSLANKQRPDPVVESTADLVKKIFNAKNFKGIVCPHEFLQAITQSSDKKFTLMKQANAMDFLMWLLNHIHSKLRKKKDQNQTVPVRQQSKQSQRSCHIISQESIINDALSGEYQEWHSATMTTERHPFYALTLDVPQAPVFKATEMETIIPEVQLFNLLHKFSGQLIPGLKAGQHRRLKLWKLPPYLIIHLKRFSKNAFFLEKNPTIVKFPVRDLDLAPCEC